MKAMRVRVSNEMADRLEAEAQAAGIHVSELVRRALWLVYDTPRVIGGHLEAPPSPGDGAAKATQLPHEGPAEATPSPGDGAAKDPLLPRGASKAPPLPLITLDDGAVGGASKHPRRPRDGPATPRARGGDSTQIPDSGPDPDSGDPDPESVLRPASGGQRTLTEQQRAVQGVTAWFRLLQLAPPSPTAIGVWRKTAGGTDELLAVLEEVTGKGALDDADDPKRYVFGCVKRAGAENRKNAAAARGRAEGAQARRELELVRGYLHGKPDDQPHYEQQLRELDGDDGLLWAPPTEQDLERLQDEVYGPTRADGRSAAAGDRR